MQTQQDPLDSQISAALDQDPQTTHAVIDVACVGGQVTLYGEVRTPAEKAAAVAIAKRVAGVIAVADELAIRSSAVRK